jgi:hypothetical protein
MIEFIVVILACFTDHYYDFYQKEFNDCLSFIKIGDDYKLEIKIYIIIIKAVSMTVWFGSERLLVYQYRKG